jgi:glycosyltransferase involved in cell wall biosynthesis
MKLEVLVSCMHQKDDALVARSNITGNVLVINQCDTEDYKEYPTKKGIAKIYSTCERGLTKSRNMAIEKSDADICMLCDDDEVFCDDYAQKIICAYKNFPQADVIIFKMVNRPCSLGNAPKRIKFPKTMKVSSWQISFKKESLIKTGVRFDPLLGAGTGNGAEEELKFLLDCQKAGLKIYFVPQEIASVGQTQSTWFSGFNEQFFINRGATTRYILGFFPACLYAIYYIIKKHGEYGRQISLFKATKAIFRGIIENKISKEKVAKK